MSTRLVKTSFLDRGEQGVAALDNKIISSIPGQILVGFFSAFGSSLFNPVGNSF